jgi:hypothetical protein
MTAMPTCFGRASTERSVRDTHDGGDPDAEPMLSAAVVPDRRSRPCMEGSPLPARWAPPLATSAASTRATVLCGNLPRARRPTAGEPWRSP